MNLGERITRYYSALIGCILMALALIILTWVYQDYTAQFRKNLETQMDRAQRIALEQSVASNFEFYSAAPDLYQRMLSLGKGSVRLYTPEGYALGLDAAENLALMASEYSHSAAPELPVGFLDALQYKSLQPSLRHFEAGFSQISLTGPLLRPESDTSYTLVGLVRFSIGLSGLRQLMVKLALMVGALGAVLMVVAGLLGRQLAKKIVAPIQALEATARAMKSGKRNVRAKMYHNDEIGRLTESLNALIETLEKEERHKETYIATISHELRTPLTSILGWAHTIKDPRTMPHQTQRGLDVIIDECLRLSGMVDQLLDLSKLALGQVSVTPVPTDVTKVLSQVHAQLMPTMARKQLKWQLDMPESLSEKGTYILGDEGRIRQLLLILLDNAMKFTPTGGSVTMAMDVVGRHINLRVEDSGVGIPRDMQDKLFEPFVKGAHAESPGSGLGLAIAKAIADQHGASLLLSRESLQGACFVLQMPLLQKRGNRHDA